MNALRALLLVVPLLIVLIPTPRTRARAILATLEMDLHANRV